jgi:hypothetical protein
LKVTAILVPGRKPVEEILDGEEADALEVGGSTRTDAFEKLQRRREQLRGHMTWQIAGCNY